MVLLLTVLMLKRIYAVGKHFIKQYGEHFWGEENHLASPWYSKHVAAITAVAADSYPLINRMTVSGTVSAKVTIKIAMNKFSFGVLEVFVLYLVSANGKKKYHDRRRA